MLGLVYYFGLILDNALCCYWRCFLFELGSMITLCNGLNDFALTSWLGCAVMYQYHTICLDFGFADM